METVAKASAETAAPLVRRSARMRYVGQGHEIEVVFDDDPRHDSFGATIHAAFEAAYLRLYGSLLGADAVEATSWTVRVLQLTLIASDPAGEAAPSPAEPTGTRQVFKGDRGTWYAWPEYARAALRPGATASGPAIVSEAETTTVVPRNFDFRIGREGALILTRRAHA